VVQDNRWDGGFLNSLSQVALESPISQQLSWPRTMPYFLWSVEADVGRTLFVRGGEGVRTRSDSSGYGISGGESGEMGTHGREAAVRYLCFKCP
jgi:hypothetical protein